MSYKIKQAFGACYSAPRARKYRKGRKMKYSFKQIILILSVFLIGIFTSELISHEPLIYKAIQEAIALDGSWSTIWTAFTGLATLGTAIVAFYTSRAVWKKTEEAKRYDHWIQQSLDANIAYLHFHHLSRNARSVAHTKFGTHEFSKIKFQEVYDAWGASLLNERFSASIIAFRNWPNSSFTDDMEINLNALVSYHHSTPNPPFEYALRSWKDITTLLELVSEIAYLRLHVCRSKAEAVYHQPSDEDSLRAVEETTKEIESLIQEYDMNQQNVLSTQSSK